jgi:hypothetical protein
LRKKNYINDGELVSKILKAIVASRMPVSVNYVAHATKGSPREKRGPIKADTREGRPHESGSGPLLVTDVGGHS